MAHNPTERFDQVAATLKDAAYVTVGLGVIAVQRLQVRRQELAQALSSQRDEAQGAFDVFTELVRERLTAVEERVGATFDRR
jgi:hypothetical protein